MPPEAKFKQKLKESFETFYVGKAYFYFPVVASMLQKAGVPDIRVAARGEGAAWIEAKANDNTLSSSQRVTIPEMVAAGERVVILTADMNAEKTHRPVIMDDFYDGQLRRAHTVFRWDTLDSHLFWRTVMGIYA